MLDVIFSWNTVYYLLLLLWVPSCLGLIVIVLLQKGKGVGFAGAFGAGPGGADAVFGPRSSKSLPQKITYTMAGIFMTLSLALSMLSGHLGRSVAPQTVQDTGVQPVSTGGVSTIDDLFNDAPAAPADTPAAAPVEGVAPAVEVPAAEAAPAIEVPAAEAAPVVVETPAPAAEVPAPAEAPAAQ